MHKLICAYANMVIVEHTNDHLLLTQPRLFKLSLCNVYKGCLKNNLLLQNLTDLQSSGECGDSWSTFKHYQMSHPSFVVVIQLFFTTSSLHQQCAFKSCGQHSLDTSLLLLKRFVYYPLSNLHIVHLYTLLL